MSSINYKSNKTQNDKIALLEQKVQMLTQQLEEQQHINENYEIYKEQLYSQMEKYVEIIDYTMKLLYKFNEFIQSKSEEATSYSETQITKVSEEEQQLIQKLHGLYSLNEPCLDNLKGVEEYQIVGEDTQVTIISKIQGVAKILVDNVKILGQNCLQHEKLKFYLAEKIVSLNKQQEKIEQEHKYMTLQIQKEIQQSTTSQLKDQSMLSHSLPNIQQQQQAPLNEGNKNNDMWVEIVSKLVEYCTTLQINQMQIQNQLNQAVQKLFDKDYQINNTKTQKQTNQKEQEYLQEDFSSKQNKEEVGTQQQEQFNRQSRNESRQMNIYQDQIESLQQLQTIIDSVQKKETQSVSPNQKIKIQKQLEKIKLETSNSFLKQTSDLVENITLQSQSNSTAKKINYQSNDQKLEKPNDNKILDNFSLLQQSRNKQTENVLSSIGKSNFQSSQERIPAGRGSRSPYMQQIVNQSQQDLKIDNFMQEQNENYKSITQSSLKKQSKDSPTPQTKRSEIQSSGQSNQIAMKTPLDSENQYKGLQQSTKQEEKQIQINQFSCEEQAKVEERVPAGRSLASSKIKQSFENNKISESNHFQNNQKEEEQFKSHQSSCQEANFSNQNFKFQSLKENENGIEQDYMSQNEQENIQSTSDQKNQGFQIKVIPPTYNTETQNSQKLSSYQSQEKNQLDEYNYKYQTNKSNRSDQNSVQLSKRSLEYPQAINKISISDQIMLDVENQSNLRQLSTSFKSPNFCMNDKSKFQSTASEKPALGFQSISQFNRFSSMNNNSIAHNAAQNEDNSNINQISNNQNQKNIDSSRHQLQISEFTKNEKEEQILNFFQGKFNLDEPLISNPPHLSSLHNKLERITHQIFPQRNSSSSNSQQDLQSIYSSEQQQDYPQQMRQSKSRERIFSYNNSHTSSRQVSYNNKNQNEFSYNNGAPSNSNMSYIDKNKINNNSNLCVNSSQEWQFSVQQQQNTQQTNLQNNISRISKTEMSWNSFENLQIPVRQSLQQQQQQQLSLRSLMNIVNQQKINTNRSVSNTYRQSNNDQSQNQNDSHIQQQPVNLSSNFSQNPLDQSQLNRSRSSVGRRKIFETYESNRSLDQVRQQQLSHDSSRRQLSQYQTANLGINNNEKSFYSTNSHLDSSRISANQQYQSNNTNYRKPPQYQQTSRNDGFSSGGVSQRTDRNPYSQILNEQNTRETFKVQLDNNYNSNSNKENNIQVMQKSNQRYSSQGFQNNKSTHSLSLQERMSQQSQKSKEPFSQQSQNVSMISNKSQKQFYSISEISKMNQQQNKDKKIGSKNYL